MNCFEHYLVELLQGHLSYDDEPVQVVKRFSNAPSLPCITLDLSGGVTTDYIYHDVDSETEVVYYRRTANINLNLWCNTDRQKEDLTAQIMDCFYMENSHHYTYCTRYHDGACSSGGSCKVHSIHNNRSVKDKCPDPDEYDYESLAMKHHLVDNVVMVEPPFDMDEFDRQPPLLRAVFRCRTNYEEPVLEHGEPVQSVNVSGVDIYDS